MSEKNNRRRRIITAGALAPKPEQASEPPPADETNLVDGESSSEDGASARETSDVATSEPPVPTRSGTAPKMGKKKGKGAKTSSRERETIPAPSSRAMKAARRAGSQGGEPGAKPGDVEGTADDDASASTAQAAEGDEDFLSLDLLGAVGEEEPDFSSLQIKNEGGMSEAARRIAARRDAARETADDDAADGEEREATGGEAADDDATDDDAPTETTHDGAIDDDEPNEAILDGATDGDELKETANEGAIDDDATSDASNGDVTARHTDADGHAPTEASDGAADGDADGTASDILDGDELWSPEEPSAPAATLPTGDVSRAHLKGLIEALVFVSDQPLSLNDIAKAAGKADRKLVKELADELRHEYQRRGIHLDEVAGGLIFRTNPSYGPFIRDAAAKKPVKMTRAQLETLAIIAYRQPLTRPEVDDIRGVDSGPVMKMLLERSLIRILGKKDEPGRPLLYGTTATFLEFFGLKALKDLPSLREFTELSDDSRRAFDKEMADSPDGVQANLDNLANAASSAEVDQGSLERDDSLGEPGAAREVDPAALAADASKGEGAAQQDQPTDRLDAEDAPQTVRGDEPESKNSGWFDRPTEPDGTLYDSDGRESVPAPDTTRTNAGEDHRAAEDASDDEASEDEASEDDDASGALAGADDVAVPDEDALETGDAAEEATADARGASDGEEANADDVDASDQKEVVSDGRDTSADDLPDTEDDDAEA